MDSTAMAIADYHVNVKLWEGIGYHWRVGWSGQIDYVGDILTVRANVAGRNRSVIGIVIPGDWRTRQPPEPALLSAAALVRWLKSLMPGVEIRGHYELALSGHETSCPGPLWPQWRSRVDR